jgi:hypothetical protein
VRFLLEAVDEHAAHASLGRGIHLVDALMDVSGCSKWEASSGSELYLGTPWWPGW